MTAPVAPTLPARQGDETRIEKLAPTASFEEIMRHTYGVRFGPDFFAASDRGEQFLRTTQLGRAVPVRRLRRPATLASDPDLGASIEQQIRNDLAH